MSRDAKDWEDLARSEPYFAILTNDGDPDVEANIMATAAFWETGEVDVAALLVAVATLLGREIRLNNVLDFGCGVGRLTLPLARHSGRVVACDIAPTMLEHARQNAEKAGLRNVTFISNEDLMRSADVRFDFICSLLVLQHLPVSLGYEAIRHLSTLLEPGGIAALQMTFQRPRAGARDGKSVLEQSRAHLSDYDERLVIRSIESGGAWAVGKLPTQHGDTPGAVVVVEKTSEPQSP